MLILADAILDKKASQTLPVAWSHLVGIFRILGWYNGSELFW